MRFLDCEYDLDFAKEEGDKKLNLEIEIVSIVY